MKRLIFLSLLFVAISSKGQDTLSCDFFKYRSVYLDSSDVHSLYTTGKEIIPAPTGTDEFIIVLRTTSELFHHTKQFNTAGPGYLVYGDNVIPLAAPLASAGFTIGSSWTGIGLLNNYANSGYNTGFNVIGNKPIYARAQQPVNNPGSGPGDTTMKISVLYIIAKYQ